jgi:RNA polymerase sigma factor (sigma-70 family)
VRKGIRSIVDNLLLELEEPERELIIQRKLEGLTFGEMAAELGKSEDAVRKLFNRSFQKLIALAEKNKVSERLGFG